MASNGRTALGPAVAGALLLLSCVLTPLLSGPAGAEVVAWGDRWEGKLGDGFFGRRAVPLPVPGLTDVTAVSAGWAHLLALRPGGTIQAWGRNSHGQLGNPLGTNNPEHFHSMRDYASRPLPVRDLSDPTGNATGFVQVAGAYFSTLGLKADGSAWFWGSPRGLSSGTFAVSRVPDPGDPTGGLTGVAAIAAGGSMFLFLKEDATVWRWSGNNLEPPVQVQELPPGQVWTRALTGASAVAAGLNHCLVVMGDGTMRAWGENDKGQLGDGTTERPVVAVPVVDPADPTGYLTGIVAAEAGWTHSLALKDDGGVYAWGGNWFGQLGDGSTDNRLTPLRVLSGATAVGAGAYHSLAEAGGRLVAWGSNRRGELGDGSFDHRSLPVTVRDPADPTGDLTGFSGFTAGREYSAAVMDDGSVRTWGGNGSGQLGDGEISSPAPAPPAGLPPVATVVAGSSSYHALAIGPSGLAWAWGSNYSGQTGPPPSTAACNPVPQPAAGLANVAAAATSGLETVVLLDDGTVWDWKDGTPTLQVEGVVAIAAGGHHFLALRRNGTVWSWGSANVYGELGRPGGIRAPALVRNPADPEKVLSGVTAVAAGDMFSLFLLENGRVMAIGADFWSQLGERDARALLPLTDIVAIAAGAYHSLAIAADGTVFAWGENAYGQLGTGYVPGCRSSYRAEALPVLDLAGATAIAAGNFHSLATDAGGRLLAWGSNTEGQLGDGTFTPSGRPRLVLDAREADGLLAPVLSFAAGNDFSVAATAPTAGRHTVAASAGRGGSLALLGRGRLHAAARDFAAAAGDRLAFLPVADAGYELEALTVDGVPAPVATRHVFEALAGDHAIEAAFSPRRVVPLSPAAGETLVAGAPVTVSWDAPPKAIRFRVSFSTDGGRTWRILRRRCATTSFEWPVPSLKRERRRCKLRIEAFNRRGRVVSRATARFAIAPAAP